MGVEENKEVVRRQLEQVWNEHRGSAAVAEFWAADAASDGGPKTSTEIGRHIDMMLEAFPDWRFEILGMYGEGDRVIAHMRATGSYRKPIGGLSDIPATGQVASREQVNIFTVRDGKITNLHVVADMGAFRQSVVSVAEAAR